MLQHFQGDEGVFFGNNTAMLLPTSGWEGDNGPFYDKIDVFGLSPNVLSRIPQD